MFTEEFNLIIIIRSIKMSVNIQTASSNKLPSDRYLWWCYNCFCTNTTAAWCLVNWHYSDEIKRLKREAPSWLFISCWSVKVNLWDDDTVSSTYAVRSAPLHGAGVVYLRVKYKKGNSWRGKWRRRHKSNCSRDGRTAQHLSYSLECIMAGPFHWGCTIKSHN